MKRNTRKLLDACCGYFGGYWPRYNGSERYRYPRLVMCNSSTIIIISAQIYSYFTFICVIWYTYYVEKFGTYYIYIRPTYLSKYDPMIYVYRESGGEGGGEQRWVIALKSLITLQWRHNEHDGVSNHQPEPSDCLLNNLFSGADQRKHQSSASLTFVRGIHRWSVNSPHKGPVTRKMFPFDDVIIILAVYGGYLYFCLTKYLKVMVYRGNNWPLNSESWYLRLMKESNDHINLLYFHIYEIRTMMSHRGNVFCITVFVRGIHYPPMDSAHKEPASWGFSGSLLFHFTTYWIYSRFAGDLMCFDANVKSLL